jgi:hypothetical protein
VFTDSNDPQTDKATSAVQGAVETVQRTAESVGAAIEDSRRAGGVLDQFSRMTREAPLRSLAIAFVAGLIVAGRR